MFKNLPVSGSALPGHTAIGPKAVNSADSWHNQIGTSAGNLWSADFVFTDEELKDLTEAVSKMTIVGDRYPGDAAGRVGN